MSDKLPKFVKVRDLVTGETSTIPSSGLPQGMLPITVGNEVVWIDREQLRLAKPKPYLHPPFTGALQESIVSIERSFKEVFPRTLQEWEDGFRREVDAEREIGLWVLAAGCLERFIAQRSPSAGERQEAFQILLICMNTTSSAAMEALALQTLERSAAQELVEAYFGDRRDSSA